MGNKRTPQQLTRGNKRCKFELNRKKLRKQKKMEKKRKRCIHLTKECIEEPNLMNLSSTEPKVKNTTNTEPKESLGIVSLQSEEKEIFKNVSMTTRISMDEVEIANKKEDRIIKDMEKRLGFRKRSKKEDKVPTSLQYDGLGFVLGYNEDTESRNESEHKLSDAGNSNSSLIASEADYIEAASDMEDTLDTQNVININREDSETDVSNFSGSEDEISDEDSQSQLKNDLTVEKESTTVTKSVTPYIPIHLRNLSANDMLRRKVKGLVNRVSTSNLKQILESFSSLYNENPRATVNLAVLDCVKEACLIKTLLPARLCAEHMLLIASLSTVIGPEFISPFLESLSEEFVKESHDRHGKLLNNIVSMFCYLYSLKTISCVIIFDIIRKHLELFLEQDLEILLHIFKSIGIDIRKSDPQALKDIIHCVNEKSASISEKCSRFTWFIETITAVKNNNVNKIPNYDKSDIIEIQKCYKSVVKEQPINLQISLQDLMAAKSKGRWWLVGAAWVGNALETVKATKFDDKFIELAKKNHMNTQVRKDIFCTLVSSEDYVHCFEKMLKLGLKNREEREIIYVTMICALKCKTYNQYYTNVIKKFCETSKSYQITTQFSIWDRLKDLKSLNNRKTNNLCQLMVSLIKTKTVSLSMLKVVNFVDVGEADIQFLKDLFNRLLGESEILITEVFGRLQGLPLDSLKNGIKVFMKHFLKNELSGTELKNLKIAIKCF